MMISEYKLSLFPRILWALTLAIGFGTIYTLLAVWLGAAVDGIRQGAHGHSLFWEQLVFTTAGTPLIKSTPLQNLSHATYRDPSGRAQEAPDPTHLLSGVYMAGEHGKPGLFSNGPGWEHRLKIFANEQEPAIRWFFVHDGKQEGAGYFVGYEQTSNRRVGFIGLEGFNPDPLPSKEWIPVRGPLIMDDVPWSSAPVWIYARMRWELRPDQWDVPPHRVYVPSGNRLRLADLARRTVTTVFEAPDPIESPGIPTLSSFATNGPRKEQPILVRTGRQIQTLSHSHEVTRVFTLPTEADRQSTVFWYEIGNGQAFAEFYRPGTTRSGFNITHRTIYRIAANGTIQEKYEVDLQTGSLAISERMGGFLLALALPAPAILILFEPVFFMDLDQTRSYRAAFIAMIKYSWPSLAGLFALALVLAVMAQRRSQAFGRGKREQLAWALFVLLLGLPAYVSFLLYRRWPIRQPCSNCHAVTPRDRVACAHCGCSFPEPALKGIEVYA